MYTAKREGNDALTANGQSNADYKARYGVEDPGEDPVVPQMAPGLSRPMVLQTMRSLRVDWRLRQLWR